MMRTPTSSGRRQRGVIMVIALVTLAIMMIGAVAALRSMNATLAGAGNVGLKRDMSNQAELALRKAMTGINAAGIDLTANSSSANYSAAMLATTPEGIPTALLGTTPSTVGGYGSASNVIDLTSTAGDGSTTNLPNMKLYYVVDRLCSTTGAVSSDTCLSAANQTQAGKDVSGPTVSPTPVYRATVRVDGPRGSQSFYQATFSN